MMPRREGGTDVRRVSTDTDWEKRVGYSRAVRVGPFVEVAGTTATSEQGEVVAVGDAYRQTVQTLANIENALRRAGAELDDVVRTRIYLTDIDLWEEVGRAHAEVFGEIRPATSMIGVVRLVHPHMLVEIEAEAYVEEVEP